LQLMHLMTNVLVLTLAIL